MTTFELEVSLNNIFIVAICLFVNSFLSVCLPLSFTLAFMVAPKISVSNIYQLLQSEVSVALSLAPSLVLPARYDDCVLRTLSLINGGFHKHLPLAFFLFLQFFLIES